MHRKIMFSFKYASEGIWAALKTEHNLVIQLLIGLIGLFLALFFQITKVEWIIGILTFSIVFSIELTNTAIEEIIDYLSPTQTSFAKRAKDISAAAVLVVFLAECLVGLFIFLPYLIQHSYNF